MRVQSDLLEAHALRYLSQILIAVTLFTGCFVLLGWRLYLPFLEYLMPGSYKIWPNAALALVCLGLSLWFSLAAGTPHAGQFRWLSRLFAAPVGIIGLITLAEFLFSWNPGVDGFLPTQPFATPMNPFPARMSPNAALAFFLLGISLLVMDTRREWGPILGQLLAFLAAAIGGLALLGYLFDAHALYGIASYTDMSPLEAVLLLALSSGIQVIHPNRGLMKLLTKYSTGARVITRLLLGAILAPTLLGWLFAHAETDNLISENSEFVLLVITNVVLFTALTWWSAQSLYQIETARKQAETELTRSEKRFRTSIENMIDPFVLLTAVRDEEGRIVDFVYDYANAAALKENHMTRDEQIGKRLLDLLPRHVPSGLLDAYSRVVESGVPLVMEDLAYEDTWDGERLKRIFDFRATKLGDGMAYTWRDVTERRRVEAELTEVQRRLMDGIEAERKRIAQDLHDGPIQDLYAVNYNLQSLRGENAEDDAGGMGSQVYNSIQGVIDTLRAICGELRSPTLAHFGLKKAILELADKLREKHPEMEVEVSLTTDELALPEAVSLGLFRICQSMLMNIARHSQAHRVTIRLQPEGEKLDLEIQDDGVGFEVPKRWVEAARQGHLGLVGASERAEALGGRLVITSKPGAGTTIRVCVPRREIGG